MKKYQKGVSILVGIIIIIAVAVVAVGGVFAYQYFATKTNNQPQVQSQEQNQNQNDQTASWKTYINSEYGFEIKYPDEAKINEANIIGGASIAFQISSDKRKRTFEVQMIKSPLKCVSASGADTLNIKIDGVDFVKYYESRNYSANISTSAYKYCAVVGNIVYNLIPRIESSNSFEADSDLVLNQMFSTFKFTK